MKKRIFSIILVVICLFAITGCGNKVKITKSETSQIEYEEFNNGNVKMQIPKGWKVEVPTTVTYSGYSFKVYNPEN